MSAQEPQSDNLSQELHELGELFKRAVRVARDNPQLKDVEHKLSQAMSEVNTQLDRATQTAKKVPDAQRKVGARVKQAAQTAKGKVPIEKVSERVKQAAQAYKETGAPEDFARGLAKSLRLLNEQVRRAIEDIEKSSKT